MAASAEQVKELRERTGAGVMDCKAALDASKGDMQGAIEHLRKKGLADAAKKAHREAKDGVVASYIHPGAKIGVLVEVNCETDFVARTEDFQQLVRGIAMHIAAASPQFLSPERVPQEVLNHEKEIIRSQVPKDKPDAMKEKIVEGKLQAFFKEQCLSEQPYIRDDKMSVSQLVQARGKESGKALAIASFTRWDVGR